MHDGAEVIAKNTQKCIFFIVHQASGNIYLGI